jgi:hypothetical protein
MVGVVSTYKPEYCKVALEVLGGGESLAAVCAEIGISRPTLYTWKDTYPEFAAALNLGLQRAQRDWERLGRSGIQGDIKNFGGSPWIFTMKNRFRDDYADQDALMLAGQNERMREELKAVREELDAKNKKEY